MPPKLFKTSFYNIICSMVNKEFIEHPLIKKKAIQKRLYQELLTARAMDSSSLIVAPTGLGKTIIAILLIAYTYKPNKSIIFLAPTKPLVNQHKKSLEKVLNIDSDNLIVLNGQISPEKRKAIYVRKGIVICATPQTIRNDINKGFLNEKNFNLIIFDEAHRAIGDYAYCEISSFFKGIKRLGLTASPGSNRKKIREVADNLDIKNVEIRTEEDIDVKDYTNKVSVDIKFLELDKSSKEISLLFHRFIQKKIMFLRKLNFKISKTYTKKEILKLQAGILARLSKTKNKLFFMALSSTASILKTLYAKDLIETQGPFSLRNYLRKLILKSRNKKASRALKQLINSEEMKNVLEILNLIDLN